MKTILLRIFKNLVIENQIKSFGDIEQYVVLPLVYSKEIISRKLELIRKMLLVGLKLYSNEYFNRPENSESQI